MKKLFSVLTVLGLLVTSCSKDPEVDSIDVQQNLKTVVLSADMGGAKASLDSESGAFAWQSGDMISVLATDGKFYDFTLVSGEGTDVAEFEGGIPRTANVTTVATYPRIVANGLENTVYASGVLNYSLPTEWNYAKEVSNVPMVAAFDEAADYMSFRQIGGVLRFPVKNMPMEADFVLTVEGKAITGSFPVELANLGTEGMTAGETTSTLTIHYSSEVCGESVEFNVPVPTGVYNKFNVTIKDGDEVLLTKDYEKADGETDRTVERADLVVMPELELEPEPMAIAEVWPFFVDARVVFNKYAGVEEYAVYVDGATTPVIVEAEDLGNMAAVLVGGTFDHNTTHTVAVAKVVNGQVDAESKSAAVEFTTANIHPLTTNVGTKFVTVGWDDVAIGWGPKYDPTTKRWSAVSSALNTGDYKVHQKRGYQVRLLDGNGNILYDLIPFLGHEAYTGAFSDSSWLGKINGENILIPTAVAFGYLEPNKDYYFQVRTISESISFDNTTGNYNPGGEGSSQPYPYTLFSERGGCDWSNPVKLTTQPIHVPSENEILYEGFDDIMVANDYMNWAVGVVPDLNQNANDWDTYASTYLKDYPDFLSTPFSQRKWTTQAFSKVVRCFELGLQDTPYAKKTEAAFNTNAGSLKDWIWWSKKDTYGLFPIFGAMRIGQSNGTGNNAAILKTPQLNSNKLLSSVGTKCIISFKMSYSSGAIAPTGIPQSIWVQLYRNAEGMGDSGYLKELQLSPSVVYPEDFKKLVTDTHIDANNYVHHQQYFEVSAELYLRNGDRVGFLKPTGGTSQGTLVVDDIKIEVVPGVFEQNDFVDDGIGTEPDNTNYDVFGLGEFPISYWWDIPTQAHNKDNARTLELYQELKASGMNIVLFNGEVEGTVAENKRIMDVCTQLGLKFIGGVHEYGEFTNERIAAIKEHLASNPTYLGEYLADEPSALAYNELGDFTKRFMQEIPDKEVYINLYPSYSSRLGTISYESYIAEYLDKIPTKSLSYDFYALRDGNINDMNYSNLDLVREKTKNVRMPFWVITQAGAVDSNKQPNEVEQRWSVWSNIALGSKGIAYFCYWTPSSGFNNYYYMIDKNGNKTENYEYIKQINADINTIGKKLLNCHADGAIMTQDNITAYFPLYLNDGKGRMKYGPIESFTGGICGCFRDARISENGDNYKGYKAMVVSKFPNRNITASMQLASSVTTIKVTQNNTTKEVDLTNLTSVSVADTQSVTLSYSNGVLTINIPSGEALLIEF